MALERGSRDRQPFAGESTDEITHRIWLLFLELANRTIQPRTTDKGLENAAVNLAAMATSAAGLLQQLAFWSTPDVRQAIRAAAVKKTRWPVNLRLGMRRERGRNKKTLEGATAAKVYLGSIGLGEGSQMSMKHVDDPKANVFKRAAELIVQGLLDCQPRFAWRGKPTPWSKSLLLLGVPMTENNKDQWWSVAKQWMDEQWVDNPHFFEPLIGHLNLGNAAYKPSLVRSQVIDDSLKKAFMALAVTPPL